MIRVLRAPPYLTVQDCGRAGWRRYGVPEAGAMDRLALSVANIAVGNARGAAGLEWALGAGALRFESAAVIATAGATATVTVDNEPLVPGEGKVVAAGATLEVRGFSAGRFLYLAVSGGLRCDEVMGSCSTYLPAEFGGVAGRMIRNGDELRFGGSARRARAGSEELTGLAAASLRKGELGFIPRDADAGAAVSSFLRQDLRIAVASDRTGYRLEGGIQKMPGGNLVTSEPVAPGVVQLPPSGDPIVLMADAPTVGGYHVLGSIASIDIPVIAQRAPGEQVSFVSISVEEAAALLCERELLLERLELAARA